jgi:DnaJ-class molecular chaperone
LEVDLPVTLTEAALGGKVDVPTPKGTITLTVPPASSSGKRLRVKGHGVQTPDHVGDLYAILQIVLPASLDKEATDLATRFASKYTSAPRVDLRW